MLKLPFRRRKEEAKELFNEDLAPKRKVEGLEALKAGRLASLAMERCASIISRTGGRDAGSGGAAEAARELLEAFRPVCDQASLSPASGNPSAWWAVYKLIPIVTVLMTILLWAGLPLVSFILGMLASIYAARVMTCRPFGRKGRDGLVNVDAVIEPEGRPRKTLVFTAHHDSARMMERGQDGLLSCLYLPVAQFLMACLLSLSLLVGDIATGGLFSLGLPQASMMVMMLALTALTPFQLKLWRLIGKESSPGAGDNLISSCLLTELAHYFSWKKGNGEGLKSTRLVFASFDGEECGLSGSAAWYREHADLVDGASVVNIDCPLSLPDLVFLTKDVNGFEALSQPLASHCAQVAASMGYKSATGPLPLFSGATDAASAARAGLEATTLMAMPLQASSSRIHTSDDTVENLDLKTLEAVISICIRIAEKQDAGLSDDKPQKVSALDDSSRRFTLA